MINILKVTFIFALFLAASTSFAEWKAVDLSREFPAIKDQGPSRWCVSYTLADQISHHLQKTGYFKPEQRVSVASNAFRNFLIATKEEQTVYSIFSLGAHPKDVFANLKENGLCTTENLKDINFGNLGIYNFYDLNADFEEWSFKTTAEKYEAYDNNIKKIMPKSSYEDFNKAAYDFNSLRFNKGVNAEALKAETLLNLACPSKDLIALPDELTLVNINEKMYSRDKDADPTWIKLRDKMRSDNEMEAYERLFTEMSINNVLTTGRPVMLSHNSKMLKPSNKDSWHALSIIGQRKDRNGGIHYIIRNSWDSDSCFENAVKFVPIYEVSLNQCLESCQSKFSCERICYAKVYNNGKDHIPYSCEHGNYIVPANRVHDYARRFLALESKTR